MSCPQISVACASSSGVAKVGVKIGVKFKPRSRKEKKDVSSLYVNRLSSGSEIFPVVESC